MRTHPKAPTYRHPKLLAGLGLALLLTLALGASSASAAAPAVTVEDAANVGYTTADVKGTVDPEGQFTTWRFQYIADAQFQENLANTLPGFEGAATAHEEGTEAEETLERQLTGLSPDTTYHLRLQAENGDGQSEAVAASTFTTLAVAKPTITTPVISALTATGAHFEAEVTPNGTDPAFETSWSFSCAPSPCLGTEGGSVAPGLSPVLVATDAESLQPNTTYTVTLTATNLGGSEEESETFETPAVAPSVRAFAAGPVASDRAWINGQINPHNSATEYWFEWGTAECSANPCQSVPVSEDADAGAGGLNVYATRQLTGLDPETTYHFRLVAKSAAGTTEGADQSFTTAAQPTGCANEALRAEQGSTYLPECRAYEMVSPPGKRGGDVMADSSRTRAASDGDAATFGSLVGFGADIQGASVGVDYLSERTGQPGTTGWSTHSITPRLRALTGFGVILNYDALYMGEFTPDLSRGVIRTFPPLTSAPNVAEAMNLYLRDDLRTPGPGSYELISDAVNSVAITDPTGLPPRPALVGASTDLDHVIFETSLKLTADATGSGNKLYEWTGGAVRLAGRVPAAGKSECDDSGTPACVAPASSKAGLGNAKYTQRMISADGSRILFQAPAADSGGKLYIREDGTRTVQINASEKSSPEKPLTATLWTASTDGSRAFFLTSEGLVDGDDDGSVDLYMYDLEAPSGSRLTLLSANGGTGDANTVQNVLAASADGHYVYFTALGQLVAGEPTLGTGRALYLWHDGTVTFIGGFANPTDGDFSGPNRIWGAPAQQSTGRITPDGRYLLFMAKSAAGFQGRGGFPGYDHGSKCTFDKDTGAPCREMYLYDADSGALRCASCDPSGAVADGDGLINSRNNTAAAQSSWHLSRALSDDGSRVFFHTVDSLVERDTNDASDVYAYDVADESVHLISSGTDKSDSFFLDASPDGEDVFFATRERLAGWDVDDAYDLYDARVGGGFPEPPALIAPCNGDSCRGGAPAPPGVSPTGSASFSGPGNPQGRRPCPRGKRRVKARGGKTRCVARKSKRARNQRNRTANNNRRASR